MAEVNVTIGGRGYPIVCDDGQEERVAALAGRIDAEARAFSTAGASLPEARLLLMSALMIADKLDEAEARLAAAPQPAPAAPPEDLFSGLSAQDAAARVEAAAKRISALAAPGAAAAPLPAPSAPAEAEADDSDGPDDAEPDPEPDESGMTPEQMRLIRRERRRQRISARNGE